MRTEMAEANSIMAPRRSSAGVRKCRGKFRKYGLGSRYDHPSLGGRTSNEVLAADLSRSDKQFEPRAAYLPPLGNFLFVYVAQASGGAAAFESSVNFLRQRPGICEEPVQFPAVYS